jgi:peroxiredoxin Q/BCP
MLTVGKKAPDFALPDQSGTIRRLKDFTEKKIIIYFYPKDSTPGCTKEACDFRDHYQALQQKGYGIIGVSCDSVKSHLKFQEKYALPFPLLADTEQEMVNAYGVWALKKFMGREYMGILRKTFILDEKRKITHIIDDVDTANATAQILALTNGN